MLVDILVLVVLIAINAYFAASEMALISSNTNRIKMQAEQGNKKAAQLEKLLGEPSRFLATIQVGITLAGFLASAFAADSLAEPLVELLVKQGVPIHESALKLIMVILVTVVLSYFTLVLGELVPKRVAMKKAEKIAMAVAGPLSVLSVISAPFVKVLTTSTNVVVRLFGVDPNGGEQEVTEEEILMMVDAGNEKGVIEASQKEMINNIFEFGDLTISDVMTHRTEIAAVEDTAKLSDVIYLAINEGFSRIPVFKEDIDNVIGVVYVKDLLCLIGSSDSSEAHLADFMRAALYYPELGRCGDLFKEMTAKKMQMAIAIDEYGGTAGIVTMEDLIEAIVGNIQDEYDHEEDEISKISDTTYTISGTADPELVFETLGLLQPEDHEYDTIGGFLVDILGRIPSADETPTIIYQNVEFTVLVTQERRIVKIKAVLLPITEIVEK